MVPGGFSWVFMVAGWFFMVPGWFMIPGWFFIFHVENTLKLYSGLTTLKAGFGIVSLKSSTVSEQSSEKGGAKQFPL